MVDPSSHNKTAAPDSRSVARPKLRRAADTRIAGPDTNFVMNPIKALVVSLFAIYWVIVVLILVFARDVFDQVARLTGDQRSTEIAEVLVLSALLTLLSTGVVRGWRWTFWLILVVFFAGILRVPASVMQLAGYIPAQGPPWYVVLQAIVGLTQFLIALLMLAGYRRSGIWGSP